MSGMPGEVAPPPLLHLLAHQGLGVRRTRCNKVIMFWDGVHYLPLSHTDDFVQRGQAPTCLACMAEGDRR